MIESLIRQAEMAAYNAEHRNYQLGLDSKTALAIHGFLKVERILSEIDADLPVPIEEDLFVMLADRFKRSIAQSTDESWPVVQIDINYTELEIIGDVILAGDGGDIGGIYFLDLNEAFVAAGGKDYKSLRFYLERILKKK